MRSFTITLQPGVAGGCRRHSTRRMKVKPCVGAKQQPITRSPSIPGMRDHAFTTQQPVQITLSLYKAMKLSRTESDVVAICQFLAFKVKMV